MTKFGILASTNQVSRYQMILTVLNDSDSSKEGHCSYNCIYPSEHQGDIGKTKNRVLYL